MNNFSAYTYLGFERIVTGHQILKEKKKNLKCGVERAEPVSSMTVIKRAKRVALLDASQG